MKITIEINNNEDVTEAIQTLEKLLVTSTTIKPAAKKTSKKPTTKAKVEAPTEVEPGVVFALAKELAKKHGSARVKEVIKKYGEKMADIPLKDLPKFNEDLSDLI